MKTQITIALLLIVSAFTACKKEKGNQVDIAGKWQVTKVETSVAGAATETYTGIASDSFEFRRNEENEMVVSLKSVNTIGVYYILLNDDIKFAFGGKNYAGKITTLTANKLEFNGVVEGSSPVVTEKYYLTK
ncbi:lipocalin family protein [Pedobacter sp. ASV1-7]|uniref:lipocalin family protein n=1 Tax=Pedobacter sp. ASV1-7 TaxID=3145237 RepID=UPI0032E92FF9